MQRIISRMAILQRRADFAVAEARDYAATYSLSFTMPLQEGEEVVNVLPKEEEAPLWQDSTNESDADWWESSEWVSSDYEDDDEETYWNSSNC